MLKHTDLNIIAQKLEISKIGVSKAGVSNNFAYLESWLKNGYHGEMSYLANYTEMRKDVRNLLPGAQSVMSCFFNYYQSDSPENEHLKGEISRYAWGEDYHDIIRNKLQTFAKDIHREKIQGLSKKERHKVYRVFTDTGPVMEKQWAQIAGIGWQGKHTNIVTKTMGSWGFLGEIITTEVFDNYDESYADFCGSCTACIDACPTQAIIAPYKLDASRCISYGTIELDGNVEMPPEIVQGQENWLFGCDICQDVCPWNRFAKETHESKYFVLSALEKSLDFDTMSDETFNLTFNKSPLKRPHLMGLRRNIKSRKSHV